MINLHYKMLALGFSLIGEADVISATMVNTRIAFCLTFQKGDRFVQIDDAEWQIVRVRNCATAITIGTHFASWSNQGQVIETDYIAAGPKQTVRYIAKSHKYSHDYGAPASSYKTSGFETRAVL
jgi:hypothetical protein